MPELRVPSDLFGVPFVMRRQDAKQLVHTLDELWVAQTGQPARTISEDLGYLFAKLFNPKTSGSRLRDLLDALPDAPAVRSRFLNPPLVIRAGTSLIVTPEGRALYGLLHQVLEESDVDPMGIDPSDALSVLSLTYEGYREVGVRRLHDAVQLLSGEAEGLRLPSIGFLLLVLVNRSTSPDTAIRRPRTRWSWTDWTLRSRVRSRHSRMASIRVRATRVTSRSTLAMPSRRRAGVSGTPWVRRLTRSTWTANIETL